MKSTAGKGYRLALTLTALTVLELATSQPANAAALYSITDLGMLDKPYTQCPECEKSTHSGYVDASVAFGVNNAGQIVGRSITPQGYKRAFLWEDGVMQDLGSFQGNYSFAYEINDLNQVVGSALVDSRSYYHAFLQENGVMQKLDSFGSNLSSEAASINNVGQIVGNAEIFTKFGVRHAILWENGVKQDLGTLGGENSWAYHINDVGQIVGSSDLNSSPEQAHHAFIWENGVMQDLGTFGGNYSKATSINNLGQVAGYASSAGLYEGIQAFLWENGVMKNLGTLSDHSNSYAQAINNSGQVVGSADLFDGNFVSSYAFLWENDVMTNLNELIPLDSSWSLEMAMDINDSGEIVGWGKIDNQTHAFLLTPLPESVPVPEPASAIALSIVGASLLIGKRKGL